MQYQRLNSDYRDKFRTLSNTLVIQYESDPITALNENGALIADMAEVAGFSYLTPTLTRIIALAKSLGGGAKPSGAGGGDCVLALFHDPSQEREFVHQLNKFDSVCVIPISLSIGVTRL
jgi:phosphomevalonate kinase